MSPTKGQSAGELWARILGRRIRHKGRKEKDNTASGRICFVACAAVCARRLRHSCEFSANGHGRSVIVIDLAVIDLCLCSLGAARLGDHRGNRWNS